MSKRGKSREEKRRTNIRKQRKLADKKAASFEQQNTETAPALHTECPWCGQHIEFPPEMLGQECDCPHCEKKLRLCTEISEITKPWDLGAGNSDLDTSCPSCGTQLRFSTAMLGMTASCPNCQTEIRLQEGTSCRIGELTSDGKRQPMKCCPGCGELQTITGITADGTYLCPQCGWSEAISKDIKKRTPRKKKRTPRNRQTPRIEVNKYSPQENARSTSPAFSKESRITTSCPHCNFAFTFAESLQGTEANCGKCSRKLKLAEENSISIRLPQRQHKDSIRLPQRQHKEANIIESWLGWSILGLIFLAAVVPFVLMFKPAIPFKDEVSNAISGVKDWNENRKLSNALTEALAISKSDQAHIQTAINELQRLATALEIGTTYRDFSQTLNDVAPNVQIALDKIEGDGFGTAGAKNAIQKCVARYVKVRSVWNEMIQNDYFDVSSGEGKTFYEQIVFEMAMAGDYDDTRKKFIRHVSNNYNKWKLDGGSDYLLWYGNYEFYKFKNDFKEKTK